MGDKEVRTYLRQLQQALPCVPPISVDALYSLHKAQDYKGMVRLIKKSMNIEGVTILVLWVADGAANKGSQKDAPAWVELPPKMPLYGTKAFQEMTLTICFRKSFLEQSAYDQVAMAISHELSHIVLDSIEHPLRREEKAVDLTAMLLGFRLLYVSGCYKEERLQNSKRIRTVGYLSPEEVRLADQILAQRQWGSKIKAAPSLRTLMVLFLVVGPALLGVLAVKWFYPAWQLHQTLVAYQVEAQKKLPKRLDHDMTWVGVRVGFKAWTYIIDVTKPILDLPTLERDVRTSICASNKGAISDGVSYVYEYRDTSGTLVGRFEVSSCP
jgi:hypothetical protein